MELQFDRLLRYAELTAALADLARRHPKLFRVDTIGKSHEGRDIQVVVATNAASGDAESKPGFWVDGNIHAGELTASMACLTILDFLERAYGADAEVTRFLDTRALYSCSRRNPNGARWALADKPRYNRASIRPYTYDEDPVDRLN